MTKERTGEHDVATLTLPFQQELQTQRNRMVGSLDDADSEIVTSTGVAHQHDRVTSH